jgi:hypothetical protein
VSDQSTAAAREFLAKWVADHYVVKYPGQVVAEMSTGDVENCLAALISRQSGAAPSTAPTDLWLTHYPVMTKLPEDAGSIVTERGMCACGGAVAERN